MKTLLICWNWIKVKTIDILENRKQWKSLLPKNCYDFLSVCSCESTTSSLLWSLKQLLMNNALKTIFGLNQYHWNASMKSWKITFLEHETLNLRLHCRQFWRTIPECLPEPLQYIRYKESRLWIDNIVLWTIRVMAYSIPSEKDE